MFQILTFLVIKTPVPSQKTTALEKVKLYGGGPRIDLDLMSQKVCAKALLMTG